jgi:hypothetical protein
MRSLRKSFLFLLLLAGLPLPAQVVSGGMPTIEGDTFSRLEDSFSRALVAQDRALLEPFLAADFELRTARSGGELTLRGEWLEAATSTYKVRSYRIRGLTVRTFGPTAVVSFFYSQQATFSGHDLSGEFFLVDIWQKTGDRWRIAARYSAGPGVAPPPPPNVKTKE